MLRKALVIASILALAGCKADLVEVKLSTSDIKAALAGEAVTVPFEATYSVFSDMDDAAREKVGQIQKIAEENLDIEDFQLTNEGSSARVEIEGNLSLVTPGNAGTAKPGALAIFIDATDLPSELEGFPLVVRLGVTDTFAPMIEAMQAIDYGLSAEEVNPVRFRFKADTGSAITLLAGGVQIEGETYPIKATTLPDGETITLTFKGGPYEVVNGGFLITNIN